MKRSAWERLSPFLAYAGLAGVLASLTAWLIERRMSLLAEASLLIGLSLLAVFAMTRPAAVSQALLGRRERPGADAWIRDVAVLGLLILVNVAGSRYHVRLDLTADRAYTLSPQTIQVLNNLDAPVKLTGFFVASDPAQAELQDKLVGLLDEYRYQSDKVSYEFIDLEMKPALAKQYGITKAGTLVLEKGQKRQEVMAQDEQGLTAAILRVARPEAKTVYFVNGHKERDPGSLAEDGYSEIRIVMERAGYRVGTLNLAVITDTLPADAAAVIIASPQMDFTEEELVRFSAYLQQGGRALLTLDAGMAIPDAGLLAEWGVRVRDDLAIDPSSAFFGDFATPMATSYPWHPITKDLIGVATFFPLARSLEISPPATAALQISPLVETSQGSWGEASYKGNQRVQFDAQDDVAGPLTLAVAIQEPMRHARLVVFGCSYFIANGVLNSVHGGFGNSDLFLNAINWLTEDAEIVAIESAPAQARSMTLTRAQKNIVSLSSALLLPLAVLAVGFAAWWAKR